MGVPGHLGGGLATTLGSVSPEGLGVEELGVAQGAEEGWGWAE